jgi:hypothetical protein
MPRGIRNATGDTTGAGGGDGQTVTATPARKLRRRKKAARGAGRQGAGSTLSTRGALQPFANMTAQAAYNLGVQHANAIWQGTARGRTTRG